MEKAPTSAGRVLVVDADWAAARVLQKKLTAAGYVVPDPATSANEALRRAQEMAPELVVVEVSLGGAADGVNLAGQLRRVSGAGIVFVSACSDIETLTRAADLAPLGYVVKPFDDVQLRCAVHVAMRQVRVSSTEGGRPAETAALRQGLERIANIVEELGIALARGGSAPLAASDRLRALSVREWEVLRALMRNQRVPAIADVMCLSQHTVRNHLKRIFRKLGVGSQIELIAMCSYTLGAAPSAARATSPKDRNGPLQ